MDVSLLKFPLRCLLQARAVERAGKRVLAPKQKAGGRVHEILEIWETWGHSLTRARGRVVLFLFAIQCPALGPLSSSRSETR